jgi:hypothetical protein
MGGDPYDEMNRWRKQYQEKHGPKAGMDFEGFYERPKDERPVPNLQAILSYNTIVSNTHTTFELPYAPQFSAHLRKMASGILELSETRLYPLDLFGQEYGERWEVFHNKEKIGEYRCHGQDQKDFRNIVMMHLEYTGKLPHQRIHMNLRYSGNRRQDMHTEIPFP